MAEQVDIDNDALHHTGSTDAATAFLLGLPARRVVALADLHHVDTNGRKETVTRRIVAELSWPHPAVPRMNRFAEQIEAGNYATFRVCVDCYFTHHGYDVDAADREPLSLVPATADVSDGLVEAEHADGCTPADREERCDCATDTFSKVPCDGCGSDLAGVREALTVVFDMREAS